MEEIIVVEEAVGMILMPVGVGVGVGRVIWSRFVFNARVMNTSEASMYLHLSRGGVVSSGLL